MAVVYQGVEQYGDYSNLHTAEILAYAADGLDWVGYYYAQAPHPALGMEERDLWESRNALLRDRLREAGFDL